MTEWMTYNLANIIRLMRRANMATKLTLRIDEKLIRRAKIHARRSEKSVSQLVSGYFTLLDSRPEERPYEMTPKVISLRGVLQGSHVDIEDYRRHIEEKYR